MIQTRPTRAFAIPVVAANRHHLHQNTRHEHDYPCWQTTAALNTRRLSMPFDVPPARYNVARFFFRRRSRVFFSSFLNNPARERNLHKRALLLRNIGHFSTIPSAHTSSSIRPLSPRQRLSIAVLANDACRASRPTPNIHLLAAPLRSLRSRERERGSAP